MVSELKNEPLVSIVVTTYNRSHYLKETLASIQNQSYPFIEVLIIDDGSEPDIALLNRKITDGFSKCTYYYKTNSGQPDSRNYGILRSKGTYIGFCDDDDFWDIKKLEKQLTVLKVNSGSFIVTGCIEYVNITGAKTGQLKCHEGHNHGYIFRDLLEKNRTASITPLMRREVFNKVGLFNPNFTIGEDWEFWRRVSYYYQFYNINEVLGYVRLHPENMSKSRSGKPYEGYLIYRKLTKSLLNWGEGRFGPDDYSLIYKLEYKRYRKIMSNHYPGILKKIKFLCRVFLNNIADGFHLLFLMLKYTK